MLDINEKKSKVYYVCKIEILRFVKYNIHGTDAFYQGPLCGIFSQIQIKTRSKFDQCDPLRFPRGVDARTTKRNSRSFFVFSQCRLSKIGRTPMDFLFAPLHECITFVRGTVNVSPPRVLSTRLRLIVPSLYQFLVPRASEIL